MWHPGSSPIWQVHTRDKLEHKFVSWIMVMRKSCCVLPYSKNGLIGLDTISRVEASRRGTRYTTGIP